MRFYDALCYGMTQQGRIFKGFSGGVLWLDTA